MDTALLALGSEVLRKAALNQEAKNFVLNNDVLFQTVKKAANRYIGGETLDETIVKVASQNQAGFKCSIEFMGENTATTAEAVAAKDEFIRICNAIADKKLYSTVSLDLSHLGLGLSHELCREHLSAICLAAANNGTEVIISAEGADATDHVIDMYMDASKQHPNLSITLQAYLHRSKEDFQELLQSTGRIRMVKGAFETPAGISIPRGEKLNEVYLNYVDQLLAKRHPCSIATHHNDVQQAVKQLVLQHKTPAELYEFESLYGIRNDQLAALKAEGFNTKVYFVYGKEWYLYLCNRIAEYPLNIFQAIKDIVG
jgi:proline dehydrogenase